MSDRWKTYVEQGIRDAGGPMAFALEQWGFLFPVYLAIRRHTPSGARVLDVGCGAGVFDALLGHQGYRVMGIDNDKDVVDLAREMVAYFRSPTLVEKGDAFDLAPQYGSFDLVYSLGVVEHFDRETTVTLVREQARCAPVVLVAVPTAYTRYSGPVTDERLYDRAGLESIVRSAGLRVRESFVYGDVPSPVARPMKGLLPGIVYRWVRHWTSFGMGVCCVGEAD